MLSDAIQVQSVIHDPRIVLAFPGQKHAGTIEYPFQILAELVAPGNFYVHTAPRILFAFLTGFVTVKLFLTLFPKAKVWALLTAIAVGPAIIHGLSGPGGNWVGVWWLVGNYETSWLLVTTGAWLLARQLRVQTEEVNAPRNWLRCTFAGLVIGLGFFAHPNITLLIIPLATLVLILLPISWKQLLQVLIGFAVGIIPAAISYVVNADITTWDPSHPPFVALPIYLNILGLQGIPDYLTAVLPYAIGLPPSQDLISGSVQSAICWIVVIGASVASIAGLIRAFKQKSRPTAATALALSWLSAFGAMVLFATFVDPVWFYATSLSILLWISIGSLPNVLTNRLAGIGVVVPIIAMLVVGMYSQSFNFYKNPTKAFEDKKQYLSDIQTSASALEAAGATVIYGSYYDVVPIGYGSGYKLRTITNTYNRIPLTEMELAAPQIRVAVKINTNHAWAKDAVSNVEAQCKDLRQNIDTKMGIFKIFTCYPSALNNKK